MPTFVQSPVSVYLGHRHFAVAEFTNVDVDVGAVALPCTKRLNGFRVEGLGFRV